ncbi:M28 family peptidase [Pelomyxa schiedti]|nr:M28 family peptidase [Pelomyxa schiedti]
MSTERGPLLVEPLPPRRRCSARNNRKLLYAGLVVAAAAICAAILIGLGLALTQEFVLEDAVEVGDIMEMLSDLQTIADQYDGKRDDYSGGYAASAKYVLDKLSDTDLLVYTQNVSYVLYTAVWDEMTFEVSTSMGSEVYVYYDDYEAFEMSPNGTVSNTALTSIPNYGCNEYDFDGFVNGNVALIQRGNCTWAEKITLAEQHGASMALMVNYPEYEDPAWSTVEEGVSIPIFGLTYELGKMMWLSSSSMTLTATLVAERTSIFTQNVIAETTRGNENNTIVVGAHLDSFMGSGINDNGSGSITLLEMALVTSESMKKWVENKIIFAWWAAEEQGFWGSEKFVSELGSVSYKVAVNMNMDMLGSPNYMLLILDGTTAFTQTDYCVNGCVQLQNMFTDYYDSKEIPYVIVEMEAWSDFAPFIQNGIPGCATDSGANEVKGISERSEFGGLANTPADPCYHTECDTYDNVSEDVMKITVASTSHILQELGGKVDLREFLLAGTPREVSPTQKVARPYIRNIKRNTHK